MILDRALQLEILTVLSEHYPENVGDLNSILKKEPRVFEANINYLSEHDLVDIHVQRPLSSTSYSHNQRITSRGLDFLSDDGGLGAILGVVTVRLHEDTVKGLLEAKLESADLPEEEKRPLLQAVRELPAEATKHLTMKLLDLGADNLPRAIELVRSLMS